VMQQFGAYLAQLNKWGQRNFSGKICDQIKNLVLLPEITSAEANEALVADFWFPETEIAGARDKEGSFMGFFFAAKGGFNAESHNHNDAGTCVMYYDGKPCLIDLGRETYTAKTFSSMRYEIWTMQSQYHNLPLINGTGQMQGSEYKARNSEFIANKRKIVFSTDISGAYPEEARAKNWIRTYTLNRGRNFIVADKYELNTVSNEPTTCNLMTCCKVIEVKPGLLRFDGNGFSLNMSYDPKIVKPEIEFIEVTDNLLKRYWPNGVTRIMLKFINPKLKGSQSVTFTKA
jgi:hypothetical protein